MAGRFDARNVHRINGPLAALERRLERLDAEPAAPVRPAPRSADCVSAVNPKIPIPAAQGRRGRRVLLGAGAILPAKGFVPPAPAVEAPAPVATAVATPVSKQAPDPEPPAPCLLTASRETLRRRRKDLRARIEKLEAAGKLSGKDRKRLAALKKHKAEIDIQYAAGASTHIAQEAKSE
jgi:hypothetical protein